MKRHSLQASWRMIRCAALAAACLGGSSIGAADTLLSGFEGNLSSSVGIDWELVDTDDQTPDNQFWGSQFVTTGVTEGTSALELTHPADAWQVGFRLNAGALAPLVAASDKLEFDITASPDATWRGVWVIMQGDGLSWTQAKQVDAIPGQTIRASIDLAMPDVDAPEKNWKTAAAASGGTWWQIVIAIMGGDAASTETTTTLDNIVLTSSAPSLPADFDNDGDVDGDDLTEWQSAYGATAAGDADGDNDTDGADFLIWQQTYAPPAVAVSAVPEPSSLALLSVAGLAALRARRARRVN